MNKKTYTTPAVVAVTLLPAMPMLLEGKSKDQMTINNGEGYGTDYTRRRKSIWVDD